MLEFPHKEHRSLPYKNGAIRYYDSGAGKTILFLHGFMEDSRIWLDYKKALEKKYRIVSIDLLGHGGTSSFGYLHSMEDMAEAVYQVIRKLRLRRIHVVGHSMGGYVALALAEAQPDILRSLTLFHSTAEPDSKTKKASRKKAIVIIKKNLKKFVSEAIPPLFHSSKEHPYTSEIKAAKEMAESNSAQGVIAAQEGMRIRLDRSILLKFSPYPVHFIVGQHDTVIPANALIKQAEIHKKHSYSLIEDCGHMGFKEKPEACLTTLLAFIEKN